MQNEFIESFSKFSQVLAKPLSEITELNVNTLNNVVKNNSSFEDLAKAKKPEDFIAAQTRLLNTTHTEVTKYIQEASAIWMDAASEINKTVTSLMRDVSSKTSDMMRETTSKANDMMRDASNKVNDVVRNSGKQKDKQQNHQ